MNWALPTRVTRHLTRHWTALLFAAGLIVATSATMAQTLHTDMRYFRPLPTGLQVTSPDWTRVAVVQGFATVTIYRMSDAAQVRTISTRHTGGIDAVAFSPDGQYLATGSRDTTIRLWQISDGTLARTLSGATAGITALAFSSDGTCLVSGDANGGVRVWNLADGAMARTADILQAPITVLAISPNNQFVAAGTEQNGTAAVLNNTTGTVTSFTAASATAAMAFTADSALAAFAQGNTVNLYSTATWQLTRTITSARGVNAVAFSQDGTCLLSAGIDRTIREFRVATGDALQTSPTKTYPITAVAYTNDENAVAAGFADGTYRSWARVTWAPRSTCDIKANNQDVMAIAADGRLVATGGNAYEPVARTWEASTGTLVRTFARSYVAAIAALAFAPNGQLLVTGGTGEQITLVNVNTGVVVRTWGALTGDMRYVSFSPDSTALLVCTSEQVRLWRVQDGTVIWQSDTPSDLGAFSMQNGLVAIAQGANITVRRLADGTEAGHFSVTATPRGMALAPSGTILALANGTAQVALWNVATGDTSRSLTDPRGESILSLAYAPDGATLTAGTRQGSLLSWNVNASTVTRTITSSGHTAAISAIQYLENGLSLASRGADGIAVWRTTPEEPDAQIAPKDATGFIGDNIYSPTGAGEEANVTVPSGETTTFVVRGQNDGSVADTLRFTGTVAPEGWQVVYTTLDGTDITQAMTGSGWTSTALPVGGTVDIHVEITPDATLASRQAHTARITVTSTTNTVRYDVVLATAQTASLLQPDLMLRAGDDGPFIGEEIYGTAEGQTITQTIAEGETGVYALCVQNSGNEADTLRITGQGAPAGWIIVYRNSTGQDITEDVIGEGWTTTALPSNETTTLRVLVTPLPDAQGGETLNLPIAITSTGDQTKSDTGCLVAVVANRYRPDLLAQIAEGECVGGDVYSDGADQRIGQTCDSGVAASYTLHLENDGNATDTLTVTAANDPPGWTVRYFEVREAGVEITGAVTGGGWTSPELQAGSACTVRVEVMPAARTAPDELLAFVVNVQSASERTLTDAVTLSTLVARRQPDLAVAVDGDTEYIGDDSYTGAQTVTGSTVGGAPAVYDVVVENDGNAPDLFRVTGLPGGRGWTVRYCSPAGEDLTEAMTGEGWVTEPLGSGEALHLHVEVTPATTLPGGGSQAVLVTAVSQHQQGAADTVMLLTNISVVRQPDLAIRNENGNPQVIGTGVHSSDTTQRTAQVLIAGGVAAYTVTVTNTGNLPDTYTLTGPARENGWTVTYFAGDTPITREVTGQGWTTRELSVGESVELQMVVTADTVIPSGARIVAKLQAVSVNDSAGIDAVAAIATILGRTFRVSVDSYGQQASTGDSGTSSCVATSADGRYIAFLSAASDLVVGDTNGQTDIFVNDRQTGVTERISLSADGAQANGPSDTPVMTPDGRYVAFRSAATNLVPGDTNKQWDVFLRDRLTGTTELISVSSSNQPALGGGSGYYGIAVSPNGRYVAFESQASNLIPGDTNYVGDIFLRDRLNRLTTCVSLSSLGVLGNAASAYPTMSDDGRLVAYSSSAANLVPGDTNKVKDIFVFNRTTGVTTRITGTGGVQGNGHSESPAISADGHVLAFISYANNLVREDTNGTWDVFSIDLQEGGIIRNSVATDGSQATAMSFGPSISADGRYVAFRTPAGNLVPGDTNGALDVFVSDRRTGMLERVSVSSDGAQGDGDSGAYGMMISGDARVVVFDSLATNLVAYDTNERRDIFAHDRGMYQPDVQLRAGTTGEYVGKNLYAPGDSQQVSGGSGSGVATIYYVKVENDGNLDDSFAMKGTPPTAGWTVKYFDAVSGGFNITTLMLSDAGWRTPLLVPGTAKEIRVEVTPGITAASPLVLQVTASSVCDGARSDAGELQTQRIVPTSVTLTVAPAAQGTVGQSIIVSASSQGSVEYRFRVGYSSGGVYTWKTVCEYSRTNRWTWIPESARPYSLVVYAREAGSTAPYQLYQTMSYTVVPQPLTSVELVASPETMGAVGELLTFTATATGGSAEYRLRIRNLTTGVWTTVQEYRSNSTWRWVPDAAGKYLVVVHARAVRRSAYYDVYDTCQVEITAPLSGVTLAATPISGQAGSAVTVRATAQGGAHLEYQFREGYYDAGVWHWRVIQAYGPDDTCLWTPEAARTYILVVYVRPVGSTKAYERYESLRYITEPAQAG